MNKKITSNRKRGFSIIEVVISMTIIAMLIPAVASVLMTILRQQLVVYQLSVMKREGDNMAKFIKDEILREPVELNNAIPAVANVRCHPQAINPQHLSPINSPTPVFFRRRNNTYFTFERTASNILQRASTSLATTTRVNLNNTFIEVETFNISCVIPTQYGSPIIFVNYTIAPRVDSADAQLRKRLFYQFQLKASTF